jgi:hypothetical protein
VALQSDTAGRSESTIAVFDLANEKAEILSPRDPDRVAFIWLPKFEQDVAPTTYRIDLDSGALYTDVGSNGATWSPDGSLVALNKKDKVVIIDKAGRVRHKLYPDPGASCSNVVWNPKDDKITSSFN